MWYKADFHCALVLRIFTPKCKCRVSFVGQYIYEKQIHKSFGKFKYEFDILKCVVVNLQEITKSARPNCGPFFENKNRRSRIGTLYNFI